MWDKSVTKVETRTHNNKHTRWSERPPKQKERLYIVRAAFCYVPKNVPQCTIPYLTAPKGIVLYRVQHPPPLSNKIPTPRTKTTIPKAFAIETNGCVCLKGSAWIRVNVSCAPDHLEPLQTLQVKSTNRSQRFRYTYMTFYSKIHTPLLFRRKMLQVFVFNAGDEHLSIITGGEGILRIIFTRNKLEPDKKMNIKYIRTYIHIWYVTATTSSSYTTTCNTLHAGETTRPPTST